MALSQESISARVMLAGKNPGVTRALTQLLELDKDIEDLRHLTLGEVLESVRHLAPGDGSDRPRHLHAISVPPQRDALAALSERELEVVRLVAEGLSNKEISTRLSLSDKTVKNHISHILAKMNLTARTQVAVYAIRAGLV